MSKLTISIDGVPVAIARVSGLHQRDPCPGGHRFRLELRDDDVPGTFPYFADNPPSPDDHFRKAFLMLTEYLDAEATEDDVYEWFLNKIDEAHCSEKTLVLEGVCSPVLPQSEFHKGKALDP